MVARSTASTRGLQVRSKPAGLRNVCDRSDPKRAAATCFGGTDLAIAPGHVRPRILASVRTRGMTNGGLYRDGVPVALFASLGSLAVVDGGSSGPVIPSPWFPALRGRRTSSLLCPQAGKTAAGPPMRGRRASEFGSAGGGHPDALEMREIRAMQARACWREVPCFRTLRGRASAARRHFAPALHSLQRGSPAPPSRRRADRRRRDAHECGDNEGSRVSRG